MTPKEFRNIRQSMGLTTAQFAEELGYVGSERNNSHRIGEYERGKKLLPPYIARLAYLIHEHFLVEDGCLPDWPDWPRDVAAHQSKLEEVINRGHFAGKRSAKEVVPTRSRDGV